MHIYTCIEVPSPPGRVLPGLPPGVGAAAAADGAVRPVGVQVDVPCRDKYGLSLCQRISLYLKGFDFLTN